jgi:hypothetical protein
MQIAHSNRNRKQSDRFIQHSALIHEALGRPEELEEGISFCISNAPS